MKSGSRTLKDAINEAFRDWVANVDRTHYLFGTVAGPHPFPALVRDFHRVIGVEARRQILERTGRLPDAAVACVGGGSNAMGLFHAFLPDAGVRLIGCEPAGHGVETGEHAATLTAGEPGILHGSRSYVLQDDEGQITEPYSISAGLDYPGVGPEHSYLKDSGRAEYRAVTDDAAMQALRLLSRTEGIIPAIESAHALAGALELGRELGPDGLMLVNLSGRGDKDMDTAARYFGLYDADDEVDATRRSERGTRSERADRTAGADPRGRQGREPGRAHRLPAGRLPDRRRRHRGGQGGASTGGADIVEVGLPHSDPVLDGPVIQTADDIALKNGVRIADVLRTVREAHAATGKPVLVMTYWNPVDRYGVERFAAELAEAGGAGCILPDLPVEESEGWRKAAEQHGLATVFVVAPSSRDERLARITAAGTGFVYAASLMGVTGTRVSVGEQAAGPGAPHPGHHRAAGLRRPRRLQRGPGRRGGRLRRRCDRRLGLRQADAGPRRRRGGGPRRGPGAGRRARGGRPQARLTGHPGERILVTPEGEKRCGEALSASPHRCRGREREEP